MIAFRTKYFAPSVVAAAALMGCNQDTGESGGPSKAGVATGLAASTPLPKPVNGWIELPLAPGVFKVQTSVWRTDVVEIPVPANGGELEYKLAMKNGDAIVYSIDYGDIGHPGVMVSEFHGHTAKHADGVGDLMFYSRTGGSLQYGQLVAPWDGIHGWYLKNDARKDAVVTLRLAGYYELVKH